MKGLLLFWTKNERPLIVLYGSVGLPESKLSSIDLWPTAIQGIHDPCTWPSNTEWEAAERQKIAKMMRKEEVEPEGPVAFIRQQLVEAWQNFRASFSVSEFSVFRCDKTL